MRFNVTMKDPDVLLDAIVDAVRRDVGKLGLDAEESSALIELRVAHVSGICKKWFRYGEYLDVQVDTDAKTCTVMEQFA